MLPPWVFKYKLYHLPFWFVYHCVWWTLAIGNPVAVVQNLGSPYAIKFAFYVLFQALGAYFNLYYLIPRFLEKRKYAAYLSLLLVTVLLVAILIVPGYYVSSWLSGVPFETLYGSKANFWYLFQVNTLLSSVASTTMAMSVKLAKNYLSERQLSQQREKEKLETELRFLRGQFNPHFLFNTINSIFVLIHRNPDKASDSLARFSDLLRYQLYECNDGMIDLHTELKYLRQFVELEKLRQNDNVLVDLQLDERPAGDEKIAPFILVPFIENAFKHVSTSADQPNWIRIQISRNDNDLKVDVTNSVCATPVESRHFGAHGLGLQHVSRRLDLLYKNRYSLLTTRQEKHFEVNLQLQLQ